MLSITLWLLTLIIGGSFIINKMLEPMEVLLVILICTGIFTLVGIGMQIQTSLVENGQKRNKE